MHHFRVNLFCHSLNSALKMSRGEGSSSFQQQQTLHSSTLLNCQHLFVVVYCPAKVITKTEHVDQLEDSITVQRLYQTFGIRHVTYEKKKSHRCQLHTYSYTYTYFRKFEIALKMTNTRRVRLFRHSLDIHLKYLKK